MNASRKALFAKIKALLAKTIENGCTEAEAFAALAKGREMMDAYAVTAEDLEFSDERVEPVRAKKNGSDDVRAMLAVGIAVFCDCEVWKDRDAIVFLGLESDAMFASWLLDTLERFVHRHLAQFMADHGSLRVRERKPQRDGFVSGCCARVVERLRAAAHERSAAKNKLIRRAMDGLGIQTIGTNQRSRRCASSAIDAGMAAGDAATWSKPINSDSVGALTSGGRA